MKKIYSKITKNRREKFQIETAVVLKEQEKKVYKRALYEQGNSHIEHMLIYYAQSPKKEMLCQAVGEGEGCISFPYLEGDSMCNEILEGLQQKKREIVEEKFGEYQEILLQSSVPCSCPEEIEEECEKIFGVRKWEFSGKYATKLNVDLCFENLISQDAGYKIIDYEWVYEFPLPLNFVIYRAIWALYVRHTAVVETMYSWKELYEYFHLSQEEVECYEEMNRHFNDYVFDNENGYHRILSQYAKETCDLRSRMEKNVDFLQVFADMGKGYSEECSKKKELPSYQVSVAIPVAEYANAVTFRIDPSNAPFVCENFQIQVEDIHGNKKQVKYAGDGIRAGSMTIFAKEDPGVYFKNKWKGTINKILVSFTIIKYLSKEDVRIYAAMHKAGRN